MEEHLLNDPKKVSVLYPVNMLCSSWQNVHETCIQNCLKTAGIIQLEIENYPSYASYQPL